MLSRPNYFDEQRQRFAFDTSWQAVIKFDEHSQHRSAQVLNGVWSDEDGVRYRGSTRGVDFLGLRNRKTYLIEAKDYRLDARAGRAVWQTPELARRVGLKVRDSLATILGGVQTEREAWLRFGEPLLRDRRTLDGPPLVVVLFVELGAVPEPLREGRRHQPAWGREKPHLSGIQQELKRCLRWVNPELFVLSQAGRPQDLGITVTNLPGAGP